MRSKGAGPRWRDALRKGDGCTCRGVRGENKDRRLELEVDRGEGFGGAEEL